MKKFKLIHYWAKTCNPLRHPSHPSERTRKRSESNNRGLSKAKPPDSKAPTTDSSAKTGNSPRQPLWTEGSPALKFTSLTILPKAGKPSLHYLANNIHCASLWSEGLSPLTSVRRPVDLRSISYLRASPYALRAYPNYEL